MGAETPVCQAPALSFRPRAPGRTPARGQNDSAVGPATQAEADSPSRASTASAAKVRSITRWRAPWTAAPAPRRLVHRPPPLLIEDPAVNALWARSERALADIAGELGLAGDVHHERAERTVRAMDRLWSDELGCYSARDVATDALQPFRTVSGLIPLIASTPHRDALLATLDSEHFGLGRVRMVPSADLVGPGFDPSLLARTELVQYRMADRAGPAGGGAHGGCDGALGSDDGGRRGRGLPRVRRPAHRRAEGHATIQLDGGAYAGPGAHALRSERGRLHIRSVMDHY